MFSFYEVIEAPLLSFNFKKAKHGHYEKILILRERFHKKFLRKTYAQKMS
jgi:hypothetical protein